MVPKDQFKPGSLGIYFEIDSKVDETKPEFAFTAKYHGKIKTQKFKTPSGQFWSQGLLMAPEDFGWRIMPCEDCKAIVDDNGDYHYPNSEDGFLTKQLGVTYAVAEDNKRKAKSDPNAKYKSMFSRHPKFAKSKLGRWCGRHMWAKKILFIFWGKKKIDNAKEFPSHLPYIQKSDEERIENCTFLLADKEPWVKTVKIDGTSSLFLLERKGKKREYWVCSRNVRQLDRNQECYHEDNVYWEVEDKYHIRDFLEKMLDENPSWKYVAVQGESAGITSSGGKIQGDPHKFGELRFFGYNFIESETGRWETEAAAALVEKENGIPWVPIVDTNYILPDSLEELKLSADGPCEAEGASGLREGYVYRRKVFSNDKMNSFKNVSREYLAKLK